MAEQLSNGRSSTHVVMVPIPAQSHLNQLLQLSTLISSYGLKVHFLGSETHNRQAKLRSNSLRPLSGVQFRDFPTPPIPAPDPDPHASDKLPMHIVPAAQAYMAFRQSVTSFVQELLSSPQTKRVVLIYDKMMSEAVRDAVKIRKVESYGFNCLSAFNLFYTIWDAKGRPFEVDVELLKAEIPPVSEFMTEETIQFILYNDIQERSGDIHNTSRVFDDAFVELMAREEISGKGKQWAIMPITTTTIPRNKGEEGRHECLEWLDKQEPRSVIYVSFGTSISLSVEEAGEIAHGLEQSKQKFLWVLRDADRADIFVREARKIELPQGFEERVGERGLVVRDWAPQLEILAHESTGGFMTHCGWNSCYETLSFGVPIAAWPMHSDQPLNAIFLTQVLKVGIMVREWDKRGEPVRAEVIKNAVERLIAADEIRINVEQISVAIKKSLDGESGRACREVKEFIAQITR